VSEYNIQSAKTHCSVSADVSNTITQKRIELFRVTLDI